MRHNILLYSIVLFIVGTLCSCSNNKFQADIELKGLGNQRVRIVYCGADGNIVDTWQLAEKDHLLIKGSCASPSMMYIYNSMSVSIMRLVVSGGDKIKVTGKLINSYDLKVEGSDILVKWNNFIVQHKAAYQVKNPQMLNPEIEKFVKSNPRSVVSTLLVLFDYSPSDDTKIDKLLEMIDDVAKPNSLLESYNAMKSRIIKPSTEIGTLNLFELISQDFESTSFKGGKPSVLFFWDKLMENNERKTVIEELKMLDQEKVKIVDINIDADSTSWNSTVSGDSTSWKHYWVPGSMMNSEVIRLQIVSTPTIIVTDSLGKQLYRGNDGTKARQIIESL
ncbi:MAG: hypothetical protein IKX31_11640 [Muribaculaceae bacterium]|nr:hypothetical protein [Muribaculaceae bacterium]